MKCLSFKKSDLEKVLIEYFHHAAVSEWLTFEGRNMPFKFHWSSWHKSSRLLASYWDSFLENKNLSRRNVGLEQRFVLFLAEVEQYRDQIVWINKKQKTIQSNMYELYSLFLNSRAKFVLNLENEDCELMISLGHEHGPYVTFSSLKWFDPKIFHTFVLGKILGNNMPLRNFRMETQLPLKLQVSDAKFDLSQYNTSLSQIGKSGAILQISSKTKNIPHMHQLANELNKGDGFGFSLEKESMELFFEEILPLLPRRLPQIGSGPFMVSQFDLKMPHYQMIQEKQDEFYMSCFIRYDFVKKKKNGESFNDLLSPCIISLEKKFDGIFEQYFKKNAA